jgi:hypothetical protein
MEGSAPLVQPFSPDAWVGQNRQRAAVVSRRETCEELENA